MSHESPPLRESFGFQFSALARAWRRAIDQQLAEEGLTDSTWTLLIHLAEGGDGIPQTQLARRMGLDASSLVRLLDLLAASGFVERRVDPADRRARLIHLTGDGRREIAAIRARLHPIEARLLADIDDATLGAISAAFRRIEARVEDVLGSAAPEGSS